MSDTEILELHNGCLRAQAERAVEYKHVAVEVPLGSPQIEYDARCDQWVPRGGVLRCLIHDEGLQLVVEIDDSRTALGGVWEAADHIFGFERRHMRQLK
jgi:hypothetical protein